MAQMAGAVSAVRRGNDGLNGPRGLLVAVVAQAVNDLCSGTAEQRQDARRYFDSPLYAHHLNYLDLVPDLVPDLAGVGGSKNERKDGDK